MKITNLITLFTLAVCLISCKPRDGEYDSLDMALKYPKEVKKLYLSGYENKSNAVRKLPPEVGKLINLKELFLLDNTLTELPAELTQLQNLKRLNLMLNHFHEFPEEICELNNLEELELGGNQINMLPECLSKLKNLKELDLGGVVLNPSNPFTHFPIVITKLENLEVLVFGNTEISTIPDEIGHMNSSVRLHINNSTRLKTLPKAICDCQSLEVIDIQYISPKPEILKCVNEMVNLEEIRVYTNSDERKKLQELL